MKESTRKQYLKIKREYEIFKELKKKLGLSSSNYVNIKEMKKKLHQSNLVQKNE